MDQTISGKTGDPVPDWPNGPSSGWTDEQTSNAAMYGMCMECGAPRQTELVEEPPKLGSKEPPDVTFQIVCPHGHRQT